MDDNTLVVHIGLFRKFWIVSFYENSRIENRETLQSFKSARSILHLVRYLFKEFL
jgi:hypothetical protein